MKDPRKPKMHYPEKQRNIRTASLQSPEEMDGSMAGMNRQHLENGHEKHPMPQSYKPSMPKMKP
jgi:hypothetical protein